MPALYSGRMSNVNSPWLSDVDMVRATAGLNLPL
jgi:hypothetical protein